MAATAGKTPQNKGQAREGPRRVGRGAQGRDEGAGEERGSELPGMWTQEGAALGSQPLKLNKEGCGSTDAGTVGKDSWQNRGGKRTKTGKKSSLAQKCGRQPCGVGQLSST